MDLHNPRWNDQTLYGDDLHCFAEVKVNFYLFWTLRTALIFYSYSRRGGTLLSSRVMQILASDERDLRANHQCMSVAFPTHVWKMPNICKTIIVWLFSHMCAFSRTYLLKSKHVWKKAPRCKYTNVFVFFQTCWVKVKQSLDFSKHICKIKTCEEKTVMLPNTPILFFWGK